MRSREKGQILPLFAIVLVGVCAMMALAIDVSSLYSASQRYRTAADAAALAGGQDLQQEGTRMVTAAQRTAARSDAIASLHKQLGGSGIGACDPAADINDCTLAGTSYKVSIKTPVTSCVSCDKEKSIQVTVRNPDYPVSFAALFGRSGWNVSVASVAGLGFSAQYAIITLRPPASGRTGNNGDITINGTNSAVVAIGGDIGVNTGSVLNGHTATVAVDQGYHFDYYGSVSDQASPAGSNRQIPALIPDPMYPYPTATGTTPAGGSVSCPAGLDATLNANGYGVDGNGAASPVVAAKLDCYKPGRYAATLSVRNGKIGVLLPGLYFLDGGIDLKGTLIGGYAPATQGVALVIPNSQLVKLSGTPPFFALNRGTAFDGRAGGQEATAVLQTNDVPAATMSVVVTRNAACPVVVGVTGCNHTTLDFSGFGGHGFVSIAGVVYAPSDRVEVSGNGTSFGYLGRLVAWTINYSGGSVLAQHYVGGVRPGLLRLDGACTAPGTPCN